MGGRGLAIATIVAANCVRPTTSGHQIRSLRDMRWLQISEFHDTSFGRRLSRPCWTLRDGDTGYGNATIRCQRQRQRQRQGGGGGACVLFALCKHKRAVSADRRELPRDAKRPSYVTLRYITLRYVHRWAAVGYVTLRWVTLRWVISFLFLREPSGKQRSLSEL
eukprot:scaffold64256_cov37-Attheya_sp.AAC.1